MPMTKAVVRSMDAITDLVAETTGITIEKFLVGGASKVTRLLYFSWILNLLVILN